MLNSDIIQNFSFMLNSDIYTEFFYQAEFQKYRGI